MPRQVVPDSGIGDRLPKVQNSRVGVRNTLVLYNRKQWLYIMVISGVVLSHASECWRSWFAEITCKQTLKPYIKGSKRRKYGEDDP